MRPSDVIKGAGSSYGSLNWETGGPPEPAPNHGQRAARPKSRLSDEEDPQQAYQRGLQDGEAAAKLAYEQALAATAGELAKTIASLSRVRASVFRDAQADLVRLAVTIARRILHREVLIAPDILEGIISVVLDRLEGQEIYRVRVHPSMAGRVGVQLSSLARHKSIDVSPDASLGTGGCVFETSRGNIDAGVETQLTEIERGLADYLENN
jgi:flagellar assembly protein FliH